MLYTVRAKVIIRVAGISGPFEQTVAWHVHANSTKEAVYKYEQRVSQDFRYMAYQTIKFENYEIIGSIS